MAAPLDEEALQKVYCWVDEVPLSRPKRNISRDFSDGVLVAEIVKHYFPKMVDIHNYSNANSMQQKMYNWETLNRTSRARRLGPIRRRGGAGYRPRGGRGAWAGFPDTANITILFECIY